MSPCGSGSPASMNTAGAPTSGSVLKSSAYDLNFQQKCIDHGIFMPNEDIEPTNFQEVSEVLTRRRPSLSPSQFTDEAFKRFRKTIRDVRDEEDVKEEIFPIILGDQRRDYPSARKLRFININDMTPDVFKKPEPDRCWGAVPEEIDLQVRQDLDHQILPSVKSGYPAAPNFFLEMKGPKGTEHVVTLQACYAGAIGARAMHALQGYGKAKPTYDNKTYTYTFTYINGTLEMYTHHSTEPSTSAKPPEYRMTPAGGWYLKGSRKTFLKGVSAFRNARDYAREQQDMLIAQVNAVVRRRNTVTSLGGSIMDTDTSADEGEMDQPPMIPPAKGAKKARAGGRHAITP